MMAIRELSPGKIKAVDAAKIRPMSAKDFQMALQTIKSSVSPEQLDHYDSWTKEFGSAA